MADPVVYKSEEAISHSGCPPIIVRGDQRNSVTTVERRTFFEKSENVSATHRTIIEFKKRIFNVYSASVRSGEYPYIVFCLRISLQIRTSLDACGSVQPTEKGEQVQTSVVQYRIDSNAFEKARHVEKVEHDLTPVVQYRMVPRIREIEVPEVHIEYDDTYVEVPVPFELPIIAPRQVPVEQVVQRNIPKPVSVHTTQRYRMPRIQPKYYDVKVPIYVPSYVEVPVPSHFVALKDGERFPEQLELGPAVPHVPSCSAVPDVRGCESYATDIKLKEANASAPNERIHETEEQDETGKALGDATVGLPTLHRRGSQGSDLGYSSSALVQGAYPSVEFVAVSSRGLLDDFAVPSEKEDLQQNDGEELLQENAGGRALLNGDQARLDAETNGDEAASEYLCSEKSEDFNQTEESTATPALAPSPALVPAAA